MESYDEDDNDTESVGVLIIATSCCIEDVLLTDANYLIEGWVIWKQSAFLLVPTTRARDILEYNRLVCVMQWCQTGQTGRAQENNMAGHPHIHTQILFLIFFGFIFNIKLHDKLFFFSCEIIVMSTLAIWQYVTDEWRENWLFETLFSSVCDTQKSHIHGKMF